MFETDTPHVEIMVEVYAVISYTTVQISRSGTDQGIALKNTLGRERAWTLQCEDEHGHPSRSHSTFILEIPSVVTDSPSLLLIKLSMCHRIL